MKSLISSEGGFYTRLLEFQQGESGGVHQHELEHVTLFSYGSFQVTIEGKAREVTAPSIVVVPRLTDHEIVCTSEKGVCSCIYPLNDKVRAMERKHAAKRK